MHYLVTIIGDPARAAGLLAMAGVQNMRGPLDRDRITARLSADNPETAVDRVRRALSADGLGDAGFEVGDVRPET
jgi:hypothetical protein